MCYVFFRFPGDRQQGSRHEKPVKAHPIGCAAKEVITGLDSFENYGRAGPLPIYQAVMRRRAPRAGWIRFIRSMANRF